MKGGYIRYVEPVEKTNTGYQKDTPQKTLPKRGKETSPSTLTFKEVLEQLQ